MNTSLQKIRLYIKTVSALKKSRFYLSTSTVGVKSVKRKDKKTQLKTFGFDEDFLRSALIDFRKIILNGEPTNFFVICNIIEKGSFSDILKRKVRTIRKEFSETLNKDVTLYDRQTNDKPKDVLDKWLNGKYFHQEKDKRQSINKMSFIVHVHKLVFVATVLDLSKIAVKLSDILDLYLKNNKARERSL
ncbi:MAG: hypothetical protein K9L98_03320 [Candidatus Pacebacteria bacterium]|nr:hypothetical protein [Candidatus Paceibacterota bacterium]MCF7863009.1 hypothetical protein [Candidatus Paceibacterota bacterium]